MRKPSLIPLVLLLAVRGMTQTSSPSSGPVDQYVQAEMQKQHIPGLALLVARDGKIVKARGYGLANVELHVPVKPGTVFQSGSVGKQFTATAVMMLVEEGKIRLDAPISNYIKDAPASWDQVTARELLSHTAGFTDYPDSFNFRKDYAEEELFKVIAGIPLAFAYATLGILIHRVTGKFYGGFLQERIFQPLGMTTTRVMSEADIIPIVLLGIGW